MKNGTEGTPDPDRAVRLIIYGALAAVAVFAFLTSFAHIYDLGRAHGQHGIAAKLLPLSVDLLIVAASGTMWIQAKSGVRPEKLARFLPRLMLWAGIGATVAANVAYGWPYGKLGAVISAWPGAVFAGLVEMVMVAVRPAGREAVKQALIPAGQVTVPATVLEAAKAAYVASVAGGNPLKETTLAARFGIPRSQARKIVAPGAVEPSLNGAHADG